MELTLDQALQKGVEAHKAGKAQDADRYYTAILKANPKHCDANHNMGVLAVGVGKVEAGLPFFKTALEVNPNIAQYWLSYIDAFIKLERIADAKAVLEQAKSKEVKGEGFDQIEKRLNTCSVEVKKQIQEDTPTQPNILDELKLDKALKLAKKKAKDDLIEEAKKIYQDILTKFPKNKKALGGIKTLATKTSANSSYTQEPPGEQLQGLVNLYSQGQYKEALNKGSRLLEQFPSSFNIYNIIGIANQSLGRSDKAIEAYNKALAIKPDFAQAYNNMGHALTEQGKLVQAIRACNEALSIKPDFFEAYNNLGNVLKEQGKLDEAIEIFNKALSIKPDYAEVFYNMGNVHKEQGQLDEALEAYKKVLSIMPNHAEAYNNMGVVLQTKGKLQEATKAYKKAISIKSDYAEAYNNMGSALQNHGKLEEAVEVCKNALAIKPDYAEACNNMGNILKEQGKLDEAINVYQKAISIEPNYAEVHYNMAFALLNSDFVKQGLDEYEWRWKTTKKLPKARNFSQPLWTRQRKQLGKTILLWSDQGIGDTLNWSSRVPLVKAEFQRCIVECEEKLVPLLSRSFTDVEIKRINKSFDPYRKDIDFHLPMGSIYKNFTSNVVQNTKLDAFLVPDKSRVDFWKRRLSQLGSGPYIGISWKSSNMSPARLQNYAPISEWLPILKLPKVIFVNLQYSDFTDDLRKIKSEMGVTVHNFEDLDLFDNIDDVAALCKSLDFVISTTCAVPFISNGVGTPTKLLSWKQSSWNNRLFDPSGPSLEKFERNSWEPWDKVFQLISSKLYTNINPNLED